jgi:16S rRNA (uracil1498-N3)-methyltransferase
MFYCPQLGAAGEALMLTGEEARHARSVRRLAAGESLWLFDGQGTMARAIIRSLERRGRGLELVLAERQVVAAPRPRVELACALPKGERQAVLLDMATQLGMCAFHPLLCERSIVQPRSGAARRWQRICVAACKQSRRAHLPSLREATTPAQLAGLARVGYTLWVADPGARPLAERLHGSLPDPLLLVVGPEGGMTSAEIVGLTTAGGQTVGLGGAILRIETAAIALLAQVALHAAQGGPAGGSGKA